MLVIPIKSQHWQNAACVGICKSQQAHTKTFKILSHNIMHKKFLLLSLVLLSIQPANAFLEYCQDIALPTGFAFADEKFPLCNFEEGLTVVSYQDIAGERFGFANAQGQIIIAPTFEESYNFQDGLALVRQNGRYGYINPNNQFVIAPQFEDAWGFNNGLAKITINGKIGFIDKAGTPIISPQFDDSHDWFSQGVAGVFSQGANKWGLIDRTGRLIAPYAYEMIDEPAFGRILVGKLMATDKTGVRFGYLDTTGNIAIAPQFERAKPFKNGIAEVVLNNQKIFINTQGNKVEVKADFDY